MPTKPRASTRSTNANTSRNAQKTGRDHKDRKPPRAHRNDTPEAKEQERRMPKTHPNSRGRVHAVRKDKTRSDGAAKAVRRTNVTEGDGT